MREGVFKDLKESSWNFPGMNKEKFCKNLNQYGRPLVVTSLQVAEFDNHDGHPENRHV